jgi:AraC-like DNA-binding protein
MPAFSLPPDEELGFLVRHITCENELDKLGRDKIMRNYMEEILIHICRYIESQPDFKKYIDKLDFLTDRRLVDIVKYIRENLDKDLSNKAIASIAYISEDYVGQFFKSLTGKNLQDYIENQRLERALFLLRTQPDNIQEIAHRVGFKDPAYFSRRFKMKFGANANAVRHNKNQMV